MEVPLQIVYSNLEPTEAIEAKIREKVAKLERYYSRIISCRVVVEASCKRHHKGNLYHVSINIGVPGGEIIVNRESEKDHSHEDLYVAIRDAFKAARRQLEDFARIQRGEVKRHEVPPHGRVVKIVPEKDYGIIETPDGREIYFHRNSLVDGVLEKLEIGTEVRFTEEMGEKGPQASTVRIVGKHHPVG